MRRLPEFDPPSHPDAQGGEAMTCLSGLAKGVAGQVARVEAPQSGDLAPEEMERRLLEMGFVEGARIEVLHEGPFGGDPIAVKLDDMRVALRRRDARGVFVRVVPPLAG
ncbi:FeoA family protein [Caulobacter sp. KR2-114]|uniref:FeoA family protein n=1 Tax=Caulobacter sp. KR2-114 TaxID=3400912 RepID=UPI003C0B2C55